MSRTHCQTADHERTKEDVRRWLLSVVNVREQQFHDGERLLLGECPRCLSTIAYVLVPSPADAVEGRAL